MAEHDTHYNGIMDGNHMETEPASHSGESPAISGSNTADADFVTPLPTPEEGRFPCPEDNSTSTESGILLNSNKRGSLPSGRETMGTESASLPDPGENETAYSADDPGVISVVPLPTPEEGTSVYSGNGPDTIPVIPLSNSGEDGSAWSGSQPRDGISWLPSFSTVSTSPVVSPQYFGQVRFLNASTNTFAVNISIDSTNYAANSLFGSVSSYSWIADGFHTVTVRRANGIRNILLQQNFPFVANQKVTMVLTDSASGGLEMIRIVDTGCTHLPSQSGCYRFANMAYDGSLFDLFLTGGETVFRNVSFQTVTSYKQAIAGSYQFYVAEANNYAFLHELPIIVIGAIATGSAIRQPLISFTVNIRAGRNYTSYIIGNTWSGSGLRILTVED